MVTVNVAVPPGATLETTDGVELKEARWAGRGVVLNPISTGLVDVVVTAFTMAVVRAEVDTDVLKTSGFPLLSTAPVKRPRADMNWLGSPEGPVGVVVGATEGPIPMTRIPRAFRALTVAWTVAAPAGATALETVLPPVESELLTKPTRP